MDAIEDFRDAYRAGNLVFFVGAGASFHSHAPAPFQFQDWAARLFLPDEPELARERDLVLNQTSLRGSHFAGIQPEVFYEHLLTLCPDVEALGLWRALSPIWLAKHGLTLEPNRNHYGLARYAERTGLPIFTTNFDTLIEDAATRGTEGAGRVLLPGMPDETSMARAYAAGALDPGRLNLFKVHGTIALDGEERLESLATTMTAITARNRTVLAALAKVLEGRRLVLLGYSGSDIDFFPSLLAMAPTAPFWFDPAKGGHEITTLHLRRMGAVALPVDPAEILGSLEALPALRPAKIDFPPLFKILAGKMKVSLSRPQKHLLLAMCLHSVGFNAEASKLFADHITANENALSVQDRILAKLVRSRIADATSQYDQAEAFARTALTMIKEAEPSVRSRRALKAQALYHLEQARQQTIGPMMRFGDARVDWRPATPVLLKSLARGLWIAARLVWLTRPLRRGLQQTNPGDPMKVRAVHAANDHLVMMLGRLISAAGGRAGQPPLKGPLLRAVEWLRTYADRSGDFFAYAGAEKYADRLTGWDGQNGRPCAPTSLSAIP